MKHEERTLQTKNELAGALKKLMKKHHLYEITVGQIVSECGMNRKTFYYHFEDIYDLVHWILSTEAVDMMASFDLLGDYEAAISFAMDYIENNDYIISCALDDMGRNTLKRFFYDDFINMLRTNIESVVPEGTDEDYVEFVCKFYTNALVGMILEYTTDVSERNREAHLKYTCEILRRSIPAVIGYDCEDDKHICE